MPYPTAIPRISLRVLRPTPCADMLRARRAIAAGREPDVRHLRATHPDEATRDLLVGAVLDLLHAARR